MVLSDFGFSVAIAEIKLELNGGYLHGRRFFAVVRVHQPEQFKNAPSAPEHSLDQGEEPPEALFPSPEPFDKAEEQICQKRSPYLPSDGVFASPHEVRQLKRLLDLLEEGLESPACAVEGQMAQITDEDTNITIAGFASEDELAARLSAADFHLISLREGWEGIVVPSKFFGALAMGRPVIYMGPSDSCLEEVHQSLCSWLFKS